MSVTPRHQLLAILALLSACSHVRPPASLPSASRPEAAVQSSAQPSTAPAAAVKADPTTDVAATVLAAMDSNANPCDDFYRYACGGWLDTTELPADQSRWGRGFSEIRERNTALQLEILNELADRARTGSGDGNSDETKVGRFFASCMDEAAIAAAGVDPLKPLLADIASVTDISSLLTVVGKLQAVSVDVLMSGGVFADFIDPSTDILHLRQGGLGLPDRDYYLETDSKNREIKDEYVLHIARMLGLLGDASADASVTAKQIVAFETEIAKFSKPRAELRDPDKNYHRLNRSGLQDLTPKLPWDRMFAGLDQPDLQAINVATPEFFKGLETLLTTTPMSTVRNYLRWHLVHTTASALPDPFADESFAFFGRRLNGQKEQRARWKRCVDATDDALGEAFAKAFVARAFAGESKQIALEMIHDIEEAFEAMLPGLAWMDGKTRDRAIEKRRTVTNKIGYPDRWRDYSKFAVGKVPYAANALAGRRFEAARQLAKVGQPVDRSEWGMTPPTVNAYYNPLINEIVFPAGILQPPFFNRSFPAPMNYGAIGLVMGHELTHGFDDQGRKFDPQGKLREWWEPEVTQRFEAKAQCIDDLYSSYEVQPGLTLNGKLTLGENIADLGGLKAAFGAYKRYRDRQAMPPPKVGNLTDEQLFFVAYAQSWCSLATPEVERVRVKTDPHSPPRFRVNGPISNFPAFAQVFSCKEGTPMAPVKRCEVW